MTDTYMVAWADGHAEMVEAFGPLDAAINAGKTRDATFGGKRHVRVLRAVPVRDESEAA
jgi:prepilin-type processing-associated H-X9-DG protein